MNIRVGFGYDVHRLSDNRKLILGGVEIPFIKGLKGHSDADVLIHAVCDALLGALALGDIGAHFPDTDPKYKGISSILLLEEVYRIIQTKGYQISNMDTTIVAERPKLLPHVTEMRKNISSILECSQDSISIKATTTEGLGFAGTGEGIAAYAIVLLQKTENT
jgi:2-C-methyl-D-erythritol 2,4-cyclodiphosphate synthase